MGTPEPNKEFSEASMSNEYDNRANKIFWGVFLTLVAVGITYATWIGNLKPSETFVVTVLCIVAVGGLAYMDINPDLHHPPKRKQ
jgi:TRAP-type C4-dicarboxylate transport system permease large subunit